MKEGGNNMDKCIVRQTIKDLKNDVVTGYELLIQLDADSLYNSSSDSAAANAIISFLTENSSRIFNEKKTFMTFTPSLLFRNTPKIFDKEKIVIQIEDNVIIHPLAGVIIEKYREEGYCFAINDFEFTPKYFSMLEYVDYIKVNISDKVDKKHRASLNNIIEMTHGFNKKFVATGVNTTELYELAKELNADYVAGSYISEKQTGKINKLEYLQGNLYQLIVEIMKDEPDVEMLETIISRDASLTYALLKMANSAYFSSRHETTSIRQAIVRVGINQLKQWVYLLSFKEEEEEETSEELLKTSFLRANFASNLIRRVKNFAISPADAYLLGMFSTLPYIIDAPIEEILEDIPISEEVKKALISKEGQAGRLYELLLCYERAEWQDIKQIAKELGIQTNIMAQVYMECMEEVNHIWDNLVVKNEEETEKQD